MDDRQIAELLRRCAAGGDDDAWRRFLELYGGAVTAGVRRVLRRAGRRYDRASREELVQEVYCRLLERDGRILRACRGESSAEVATYLLRVAESVAVDRLRSRAAAKRGRDRLVRLRDGERRQRQPGFVADSPGPEARLLARERRRRAFSRCRRLAGGRTPERDLSVLFLAYCRGYSSREIARRLGGGLTPARVDSLMHRLRRRLARGGIRIPRRP
jgi:RNA polymerase sigma factor (sigma-70 family)